MSDGYLGGRMLIAMPGIDDPRFERALIMMCAHDRDHAMGLTVNRPIDGLTTAELLVRLGVTPDYAMDDSLVLFGGPVERERGFVLHTDDYDSHGLSQPVVEGLAWTAAREVLEAMAHADRHPRRALLALGYAGWSGGQLEREFQDNVWLTCEPDEALLFDGDHDTKWSRALAKIGVSVDRLSVQAGRA